MSIWDDFAKIPGWDKVQATPEFTQGAPQFIQQIHDALFNSGVDPTSGQLALLNGGAVEANPYSVVAQLKKTNASQNHATMNAANNANLEESGAAVGALNANSEAYKQNYANEGARVGAQIQGSLGNFTNLISGIFGNLEANPPTQPDTTPSIGGVAGAPAPGGSEADRPLVNGALQVNPWHIPSTTGVGLTVAPKPIKKPVLGGLGHIT